MQSQANAAQTHHRACSQKKIQAKQLKCRLLVAVIIVLLLGEIAMNLQQSPACLTTISQEKVPMQKLDET